MTDYIYYNIYKNGKYETVVSADKLNQYKNDPSITIILTEKDGWKMDNTTAIRRIAELADYWYSLPDFHYPDAPDRKLTCFNEAYEMNQKHHPEVHLSLGEIHTSRRRFLKPIEEKEAWVKELKEL